MRQAAVDTAIARAIRDTIGDAVRRAAHRFRDREALRFGPRAWSYRDLDRAADRVARALLATGLNPGDRVVAYGRNSDGYMLLWLGCCRAGLVHVPTNYALTATELSYILAQSGARALFHQPALAEAADAAATVPGLIRGTIDSAAGALDALAAAGDARWDSWRRSSWGWERPPCCSSS